MWRCLFRKCLTVLLWEWHYVAQTRAEHKSMSSFWHSDSTCIKWRKSASLITYAWIQKMLLEALWSTFPSGLHCTCVLPLLSCPSLHSTGRKPPPVCGRKTSHAQLLLATAPSAHLPFSIGSWRLVEVGRACGSHNSTDILYLQRVFCTADKLW